MNTELRQLDRLARAALCRVAEPGDPAVHARIERRGAAGAWDELRASYPDVSPERDLAELEVLGGRLVVPGDDEWPDQLSDLARRTAGLGAAAPAPAAEPQSGVPFALWVRGPLNLASVCMRSVAVVGARAATDYGVHVAGGIAGDLADRGWTVVSGGAYGIDGAAHRGALAVAGGTVAVLAGGADVLYPRGNAVMLERVIEEGLVITEASPGAPSMRRRFLTRNRIIAALSRGTVVVEANVRSGALNTARHARLYGRRLMAVPGPATSAMSSGCHHLLRQHREEAALVTTAAEVIEEIGAVGELAPGPSGRAGPRDGLPDLVLRVLDAVPPRRPAGPAVIGSRARVPLQTLLGILGPLVAEGLVESRDGGYRLTELGRLPSGVPVSGARSGTGTGTGIPVAPCDATAGVVA